MHPVYRQNTTNHRKFVRKNISNSLANVILPKDTLTREQGLRFGLVKDAVELSRVKMSFSNDN